VTLGIFRECYVSWLYQDFRRINGLYMFRALLADPQEVLHKRHLIHCLRVTSVGYTRIAVSLQSWCSQLTKHARNIPSSACVAPTEDEQVMLEKCSGP
jgi:hypothetical protein